MLSGLDLALLRLLRTRGHRAGAERAIAAASATGEHGLLWLAVAAAGTLLDPGHRRVYLRAIRAVLAAYAVNQLVKIVVRRPRPRLEGLPPLTDTVSELSFPSAHAATSFAAARVLSARLPAPLLYGAATAMALSRPYLGVHYPSDSLAGAALGHAVGRLVP